jgi:hypothetical protein
MAYEGWDYPGSPIVDAVLLYGCLFVQGILAFIHSRKRGKTSITVTAIIALLWYAVVLVGITAVSIINDDNYVANLVFDGFWVFGNADGIYAVMVPVLMVMYLYPPVVCALTAVWCAAKKGVAILCAAAALVLIIVIGAALTRTQTGGAAPSPSPQAQTGGTAPSTPPQAQTGNAAGSASPQTQTNGNRLLWDTREGMPLDSVQSEAHAIAGRYKWYSMTDTMNKSYYVQEYGADWEWIYDVRRPMAVAFERNDPSVGNATAILLVNDSSVALVIFHNSNMDGLTYDTRDLSALDISVGLMTSDW